MPGHRIALITDSNVGAIYGRDVRAHCGGEAQCNLFQFPAGEPNKTRATWTDLTDQMLAAGLGRDTVIVALGGGVVGDLAGFVAATYMRGIPYIQVPTSMLAMIDSSVGGKTGIDTPHGKNLVGAFHQPSGVIADVATLSTLSDRDLCSGAAEAVKHGAIADHNYFSWLVRHHRQVLERDIPTLVQLVGRSVEIKAEVVSQDEREAGLRAILNFGHTIGHALESASGFDLAHGEAVAIGMVAEAELGAVLGITDSAAASHLRKAVTAFGLPCNTPASIDRELVLETVSTDKKSRAGSVRFALLKSIGSVARDLDGNWTHRVQDSAIRGVLDQLS